MSDNIFAARGLYVTRLAGPADDGADRRRWQFTTVGGESYAHLRADELERLIGVLITDLRVPDALRPPDWRYLPYEDGVGGGDGR